MQREDIQTHDKQLTLSSKPLQMAVSRSPLRRQTMAWQQHNHMCTETFWLWGKMQTDCKGSSSPPSMFNMTHEGNQPLQNEANSECRGKLKTKKHLDYNQNDVFNLLHIIVKTMLEI